MTSHPSRGVLPDTSVWVAYLRAADKKLVARFQQFLRAGVVFTCGQVAAELMAGAPPGREAELWRLLEPVAWVHLDRRGWRTVGTTAAELRRGGGSVPLTDIGIAVAAATAGAAVWTTDGDFQRMVGVLAGLSLLPA